MARKGFLAEVQRQIAASQREKERAEKAAAREHQAAVRNAEKARKAEERAVAQAAKATEAERKRLEREAKAAHVAAKQAEAEQLNAELAETYDAIDGLLAATLEIDDYVDLDELRRTVEQPAFDRTDLEAEIPVPSLLPEPPKPEYEQPEPPKGMFGKKKKLAEMEAAARAEHEAALSEWQAEMDSLPAQNKALAEEHTAAENERTRSLSEERARYEADCAAHEAEVAEHNASIDALATNLGYGTVDAVEEYVSIVLSKSAYPDQFPTSYTYSYAPETAELGLKVLVPGPDTIPSVKAYKYTKASDEITSSAQSQKASIDRYLAAVRQVGLRSLHEVFEADRRGLIRTISLEVGTETIDPATGNETYVPFVAVAAERDVFMSFDLAAVQPAATLEHLGAAVSKNPLGLVPATTTGVRTS